MAHRIRNLKAVKMNTKGSLSFYRRLVVKPLPESEGNANQLWPSDWGDDPVFADSHREEGSEQRSCCY